jgi:hypothetical protein
MRRFTGTEDVRRWLDEFLATNPNLRVHEAIQIGLGDNVKAILVKVAQKLQESHKFKWTWKSFEIALLGIESEFSCLG